MKNYRVASRRNSYIKLGIFLALLVWFSFLMAEKIDLATADLGRHIKNGEWIVEHNFNLRDQNSPLFENFYSYTNPHFSTVNHHWGAGVIFYYIWKYFGFAGLSLFYIFLSVLTFAIFFRIAKKNFDFTTAALLSLLLVPLMAERREIRPEIFSCFFAAVFLGTLWRWQRRELIVGWLYVLPLLIIFWANLHIYFFLGIFLIGVFWLSETGQLFFSRLADDEFFEKVRGVKNLTAVLILSVLASFLSPFGVKNFIYPFYIFKNYGYTIVENKSVWFVENYGIINPNFLLIKIVLALMLLSFIILFFVNRKKFSFAYFLIGLFFGILGWMAIRNLTLFGFFALPILAGNIGGIFSLGKKEKNPARESGITLLYIFILIFAAYANWQFVAQYRQNYGIGLLPRTESAAEFIRQENITGPIFNNYDFGGYLIFNLPAKEKVFVDNRPEAYPDSFFSKVYKPMQENQDVFKKVDEGYNFNAVVFYRNDITPWGMNFLKMIKSDPNWAPVYSDNYAVIYLKKNKLNQPIIEKFQ